jgi:hypothetical protein
VPGLALGGEEGAWAGMAAGREEDVGAALDECDREEEPCVGRAPPPAAFVSDQ